MAPHPSYLSPVKRICVFEHSVMTNFNCACPAIQRGQGSGFLSEGSWLTACMSEQRRLWRDCADAQARLNLRCSGERGGSVVECRTPEREVRGLRPTAAVLCPWARHFTPRKYWLITQEAMAPSRHDWKIVDWDVKPQHNQPTFAARIGYKYQIRLTRSTYSVGSSMLFMMWGCKWFHQ